MKIDELFPRCAFDAIDQLGQRICTEHEPQHPNSGEESDILHHSQPPQTGVPSCFEAIDCVTSGWQPSDLILAAARPSMGKTAFGLSMARNIAVDHGQGVAYFSLEMSAAQFMMRLITVETGLGSGLSSEQQEYLESATKTLVAAPLYIDDTPALSAVEFRSKARRLKMHHDVKVIIIDYLQLMPGNADTKNGSREREEGFILRTLKETAKELDVPIIVLSQLNPATEMHGGSKRPQLSDLRESGMPIEHADIVAFIHRPEYYGISEDENGMPTDGSAEFIIAKHRNGALCNIKLRFQKERVRFTDIDAALHISTASRKMLPNQSDVSSYTGGSRTV